MKYICVYCDVFVFDADVGDESSGLKPGARIEDIAEGWTCPVCGKPKSYLKEISDEDFEVKKANYDTLFPPQAKEENKDLITYRDIARTTLAGICAVHKVCDGNPDRLCMGQKYGRPIGFGGAGQGRTFDAKLMLSYL